MAAPIKPYDECAPACSVSAFVETLCLDGGIDDSWGGVLLELVVLAYAFVGVAVVADSYLVVSLETLCVRWNVREDVAGASFMAFGSAAPEIIINAVNTIRSVLRASRPDSPCEGDDGEEGSEAAQGIGAILGSGMIAFTVIPGCCGLFTSSPLQLKRRWPAAPPTSRLPASSL